MKIKHDELLSETIHSAAVWAQSLQQRLLSAVCCSAMADRKGVLKKIRQWCKCTFGGSGDIEKRDAVHIVDWLASTYGKQPAVLVKTLQALKMRLEVIDPTWSSHRLQVETHVPQPPREGESERIVLSPESIGFLDESSEKGRSKIDNFLEKPYNSLETPY